MTTLANIISILNDRRGDTTNNSVDMTADGFRAINGALDIWNQTHEWEFQIEKSIINYNPGISYYTIPMSGTAVVYKAPINLKYYKGSKTKEFDFMSESSFDSSPLSRNRFAISTVGQTARVRVHASGDMMQIDPAASLTSNGTWIGASAISNVATDSYEYFDLGSSVSFDYSGTSGTITKTLDTGIDLSKYRGRSSLYWNMDSTVWTNWSSATLKIGTDSSNYYTASVTSDYLGEAPTSGQWSKFKIAWSSLTAVGSPTITDIKYIQLTIAFSSNPSSIMRIENFFISEDVPLLFEYYSNAMVISGTTKYQKFQNSATTTDNPLWTGQWDFVTESFVNSVLEILFAMTGEYSDMNIAINKVTDIVKNLKSKLPSRRRYPGMEMKFETE